MLAKSRYLCWQRKKAPNIMCVGKARATKQPLCFGRSITGSAKHKHR